MATVHYSIHEIQLQSLDGGTSIIEAGGKFVVCTAGSAARIAVYDPETFQALTQPLTPTRGKLRFAVLKSTVDVAVDLYGHAPGGQWVVAKNKKPGNPTEIYVDTNKLDQVAVIPFSIDNFAANTETSTGFTEPANAVFTPFPWVRVLTADSGMTINVGTLSTDSGDADGFIAGVSLTNLGAVAALILNSANTMGALFERQDSANSGDLVPMPHVSTGKVITLTLSASADTAAGLIHLPYHLSAA